MKRVKGSEGVALIECVNPSLNKWRVRWDVQVNASEGDGREAEGVNYMEEELLHKPTFSEMKELITKWFNQSIDDRIVSGFAWKDYPVWLSTENQFNYKAAYDLAAQTAGETLPVTFKFGSEAEPVYYKFETMDNIKDFYIKSVMFVQEILKQGWMDKDTFDFSLYQV